MFHKRLTVFVAVLACWCFMRADFTTSLSNTYSQQYVDCQQSNRMNLTDLQMFSNVWNWMIDYDSLFSPSPAVDEYGSAYFLYFLHSRFFLGKQMQGILASGVELSNIGNIPISDKLKVSRYFNTMLSQNVDFYQNKLFVAAEGNLLLIADIFMTKSYSFKLLNMTQYNNQTFSKNEEITNLLLFSEPIIIVSSFTKVIALDTNTLKMLWSHDLQCVYCVEKRIVPKIILHEKSNSIIIMYGHDRILRIDSKGNKVDIPINFLSTVDYINGISLTRDRFLSMVSFHETSGNSKVIIFDIEDKQVVYSSSQIIKHQCSRITSSYITLNLPTFNIWIQCQSKKFFHKIETTTFGIQVNDQSSNMFTMTSFKLVGHADDVGSKIAMIDDRDKNTLVVFDLVNSSKHSTQMLAPKEGYCSEVLLSDYYYANCLNGDRFIGQYLQYSSQ